VFRHVSLISRIFTSSCSQHTEVGPCSVMFHLFHASLRVPAVSTQRWGRVPSCFSCFTLLYEFLQSAHSGGTVLRHVSLVSRFFTSSCSRHTEVGPCSVMFILFHASLYEFLPSAHRGAAVFCFVSPHVSGSTLDRVRQDSILELYIKICQFHLIWLGLQIG
jgi:hypothetical protein